MEGQDPRELYEHVAERLKTLRSQYNNGEGISQKALAQLLGISQQSYASYESAQNRITLEMLNKIARFYKLSVSYFLNAPQSSAAAELMEYDAKSFTEDELKEILTFVRFIEQRRNS